MRLFWERGYEGTSVGDLAQALGINKPSLYAAFGCKENLFYEALDLYERTYGCVSPDELDAFATAREAIAGALHRNAETAVDPTTPRGCFIVLSAAVGPPQDEKVRAHLTQRRLSSLEHFTRRIKRGIADGDVPAGTYARAVASFYTTVINGIAIQARDGAPRAVLDGIVDGAMAAWDTLCARSRH
ncbi:TetR/AcrR family transcriptional regulator [Devosia geojensis]|nr:TetR/AcrR family transcriptional regulator [Devosia geojensis]